jgi:alkaline phosphatase D
VLGQQVIAGSLSMTPEIAALLSQPDDLTRSRMQRALAAARAGLPVNMDQWDGYPAARERLLAAAIEAEAQLLVLAGDSHNAWAFDLDRGGMPAGAEFAVHSVTSPGFETSVPGDARAFARTVAAGNRQLRWADTSRRGYLTLELTPEVATGRWHFLETVREPSLSIAAVEAMTVARGRNRFVDA